MWRLSIMVCLFVTWSIRRRSLTFLFWRVCQSGRYQAAVTATSEKLYAVGGCDTWNCMNTVEMYDSDMQAWNFLPPMNTARRGCGATIYQGKLFVMNESRPSTVCGCSIVLEGAFWRKSVPFRSQYLLKALANDRLLFGRQLLLLTRLNRVWLFFNQSHLVWFRHSWVIKSN